MVLFRKNSYCFFFSNQYIKSLVLVYYKININLSTNINTNLKFLYEYIFNIKKIIIKICSITNSLFQRISE